MALTANMNRDVKKQRKPFTTEDFCFFVEFSSNKPEEEAALAYMALVREKKLPPWALGVFSDFKHGAQTKRPIDELVMLGEDLILLAPVEIHEGFEGTLVAEQSASEQIRDVEHMGLIFRVQVPPFEGMLFAQAGMTLDVIGSPEPIQGEADPG